MLRYLPLIAFIETGFAAGAVGMFLGTRKRSKQDRKERWLKFGTYFLIVHLMIGAGLAGKGFFSALTVFIAIAGAVEFTYVSVRHQREIRPVFLPFAGGLTYLILAASTVVMTFNFSPIHCVYVYTTIAVLDAYSQIWGQLFGKQRLAPNISPSKTVEGSLGGAATAVLAAYVLRDLAGLNVWQSVLFGLWTALAGISGDLLASWYKRRCGVKDYSSILPGQGGVIDRFNSFLAVSPGAWILFTLTVR